MEFSKTPFFVIDAGNTRLKIAEFQNDDLIRVQVFTYDEEETIKDYLSSIKVGYSLLSGVIKEDFLNRLTDIWSPTLRLNGSTPLPISLEKYQTPTTLGADRVANAVAGNYFSKGGNALIIDIGTCLKFDFVDSSGSYQGGSIAPGIGLRFKSMNDYTANLPLIEDFTATKLVGDSTKGSMMSGVINGITAEISGFIDQYTQQFPQLTIFLTGGDAILFDNALKSSIFVDQNLTLKGLFLILKHNV
jgi:type III pantothenate kinase